MTANSAPAFGEVVKRLDEIVEAVREKGTTLEESLDLFDEAIALGLDAVGLVDTAPVSPEEGVSETGAARSGRPPVE